jgi:16S rRNA (cytidine1402-2'-O)-methyltransferase
MSGDPSRPSSDSTERSPAIRGTLFVCATPIGNLEDLSPRAQRVLAECDVIAAERPGHTRKLLAHFGIPTAKLTPCAESTSDRDMARLVERLVHGHAVALVTDAGTPAISDPGARLVALAHAAGVPVCPVPGPSSLTAALSVSGFTFERVLFLGFLAKKPGDRRRALEDALETAACVVFFESPERIRATLTQLAELAGARRICLLREASKIHEEVLRGAAAELLEHLPEGPIGEFTAVVAAPGDEDHAYREARRDEWLVERILALDEDGVPARGIVRSLVLLAGVPRNHAQRLVRGTLPEEDDDGE